MSQACISYGSLNDAASEAAHVSKKLSTYSKHLGSQVLKRLNAYSGSSSSYIVDAREDLNNKISDLVSRSEAYSNYEQDLRDLKDKCDSVDRAVKTKVSTLTSSFKSANGIRDSKVINGINYFLTDVGNKTVAGRWLDNKKDQVDSVKDYLLQDLEDWWDYEGGAELIKGITIGVLEAVIAVCAIVGAALSGGALIVVIAGIVAGAIALVNAAVNIANEVIAYDTTKNGDPATGRRRSDINTSQEYLRSTFLYDDHGKTYDKDGYESIWDNIALGIDVVNFVCTSITFVDGFRTLLKNAYKWTSGSMASTKNLKLKNILTKDNFAAFKSKVGSSLNNGLANIKTAFKSGDYTKIGEFMVDFGDDFMNNLKKGYTFEIFAEDKKTKEFIKHGANLTKTYAGIAKTLVTDGISFNNVIGTIGIKGIVLGNVNVAKVVTYNGSMQGAMAYNDSGITVNNITSQVPGVINVGKGLVNIFNKLISPSNISIEIPEVTIPDLSGINSILE